MPRSRSKNKLIGYLKTQGRKLKRLRPKAIARWLETNVSGHPFTTGILFFYWTTSLLKHIVAYKMNFKGFFRLSAILLLAWLILVRLGNLLRDRNARWYYRKKFVLVLLALYAPIGIVFLWAGSKFKRITKIILTLVFGLIFLSYVVYMHQKYDTAFNKSTLQMISDMIEKSQRKTYLKMASADFLEYLQKKFDSKKIQEKLTPSQIAQRYAKCVVSIITKDCMNKEIGQGSGFIASENGIIVTNFHVIEGACSAEVNFDGKIFKEVELISGLSKLDIALLKIDASVLPELPLGNSDSVASGQAIVAIGNPLGLEHSVSNGIVSATRAIGKIELIQMTAPVSMGSSGGPVINEYGQAIGITTVAAIWGAQNVNFAVPINYIKLIAQGAIVP